MEVKLWFLIIGAVFVVMALTVSLLRWLPVSAAMFYLAVGIAIGPAGLFLLRIDPLEHSTLLEHVAEVAVIVSLFTAGLKLRLPLRDRRWMVPLLLATVSMGLSVAMVAAAGVLGLGLPIGAAVLLGAVLAPTDPVLASEVQLSHPSDRDRLRFAITGEAGLNDGTAFPFVMLGVGLLALHDIGAWGWRWFLIDLLWATGAGLLIGWVMGRLVGRFVLYLRREHKEAVGLDDFLALGLIASSYGVALLCHAYGFLAVFAAGLALRSVEMHSAGRAAPQPMEPDELQRIATDPHQAGAYMAQAMLAFNEQLERIGEVIIVAIVGSMLALKLFDLQTAWFVPLLLLVIRPASVLGVLAPMRQISSTQRALICWFGIRGVGSIYYLMYGINYGVPDDVAQQLVSITLAVITVSIIVHGLSAAPIMNVYEKLTSRRRGRPRALRKDVRDVRE